MLDPASGPRLILNRLWQEVSRWNSIGGIWLSCRPGHLSPAGTFIVGEAPPEAEEIAGLAPFVTAPIATDGLPVVARQLRDGNVPIAVILVSHQGAEEAATFLIDGLSRYCMDRLRVQLEVSELAEENHVLRESLTPVIGEHEILTVSGTMRSLIESAVRAAASTATVLIQGETGSGKELLARLIHSRSHRAHKPMVTVNASALSPSLLESELFGHVRGAFTGADSDRKGVFEIADGGTLFLDEVGELGQEAQVRLLRVLQERTITRVGDHHQIPVDVRILAATHRDLQADVAAGRFREDLFYRLHVVALAVPALRQRAEDIPLLVNHFLQKYNRINFKVVDEVPRSVLEMLCAYPWPGNVRELENCVLKAVVLSPGTVYLEEFVPPTVRGYLASHPRVAGSSPPPPPPIVDHRADLSRAMIRYADLVSPDVGGFMVEAERILIGYALDRSLGVKLRAAKLLGINRVTLDRKIAEYHIQVKRGHGVVHSPAMPERGDGEPPGEGGGSEPGATPPGRADHDAHADDDIVIGPR